MQTRKESKIISFVKQFLIAAVVIGAGICMVPDPAAFKPLVWAVAIVCIMTALIVLVIGVASGWGVLPGINFKEDIDRAMSTPEGSARVWQGFLVFLGLALIAMMKAQ